MRIRQGLSIVFFSACLLFIPSFVFAAALQVSWLPNQEADLGGYLVYCGKKPGTYTDSYDAGNVTSFLLTGAQSGVTYYVAVAAYDTSRNESPLSLEKSITVPASSTVPAPSVPSGGITLLSPSRGALVSANPVFRWSGNGFASYRVYLSTNGKRFSRIYTGTGTSCSIQKSFWTLLIPSGTTLSWYVQGSTSSGKSVKSEVLKFKKG
jgi:hypothetical protein